MIPALTSVISTNQVAIALAPLPPLVLTISTPLTLRIEAALAVQASFNDLAIRKEWAVGWDEAQVSRGLFLSMRQVVIQKNYQLFTSKTSYAGIASDFTSGEFLHFGKLKILWLDIRRNDLPILLPKSFIASLSWGIQGYSPKLPMENFFRNLQCLCKLLRLQTRRRAPHQSPVQNVHDPLQSSKPVREFMYHKHVHLFHPIVLHGRAIFFLCLPLTIALAKVYFNLPRSYMVYWAQVELNQLHCKSVWS